MNQELKKRIITGIAGGALVIFLIAFSPITFALFCCVVSVLSLIEFYLLFQWDWKKNTAFFLLIVLLMLWLGNILPSLGEGRNTFLSFEAQLFIATVSLYSNLLLFAIFGIGMLLYLFSSITIREFATQLLGFFYFALPWLLFFHLAISEKFTTQENYRFFALGVLFLIWINDIGAYFVGKYLGKHLLFPKISPKKTWEGFGGGLLATLILAFGLAYIWKVIAWKYWIFLGLLIGIGGIIGDLIESKIKRELNVKDSGALLPGHGGILDRFDAFIWIVFLLYLSAQYI